MRWAQPNFFLPFDKAGIDPFTDLFEIRLVLEGTVRGTGGLALAGDGCETTVPGLYAAGDVATRELVTGGPERRRQPQRGVGYLLRYLGRTGGGSVRPNRSPQPAVCATGVRPTERAQLGRGTGQGGSG